MLGFLINAGIIQISTAFTGPVYAQILAFPVAVSVTWWLNRKYTFGASAKAWHAEWVRYIVANAVGWCVINGVYFFLIIKNQFFFMHPLYAISIGAVAGIFVNFSCSKWLVFR